MDFLKPYQTDLIYFGIVILVLLLVRLLSHTLIGKLGRKSGINIARIKLIRRYISIFLGLIAIFTLAILFGADLGNLVLFSPRFLPW